MLPTILAKQLEKGICDYIETTFPMTNEPFKGSVQNLLATKDAVYHEPYIAVRLPFRQAEEMPTCFTAIHPAYLPYVHQQKAFDRLTGDDGRSTLIATGTGSGKTECFLYPILEYCYRHRDERGIKALIIYPMNALASDQAKRIAELIHESPELHGNVTVGMYVGGHENNASRMMSEHEVITDKETLRNNPPDILMTNYKMLDYLLVRPVDAELWKDNGSETLKYIAVDELHTFDGAQGTDLACLLRRLKRRLGIYDGYLCCVGTSATMGSKESNNSIIEYGSEIFGEIFDKDAVITEDRLTPAEFFAGSEVTQFTVPTKEQIENLETLAADDKAEAYLSAAVAAWFPAFTLPVMSDEGRLALGSELMHHSFVQAVIHFTGGNYYQASAIAEELQAQYPELKDRKAASTLLNSLFALISHARIGQPGKLRPFLFVNVQLWMRELRRLLAKVTGEDVTYALDSDLNEQQKKEYLPVVNCRDCGITGWTTVLNERSNGTMVNLQAFYNKYFRADDKIVMLFPRKEGETMQDAIEAKLCPDCLQVTFGSGASANCPSCGGKTIPVFVPQVRTTGSGNNKQYICPCCGSRRGLSLMGLRNASEISASLAQMFASKFNDDKKTLAFSDSVQDASHKAGFFNSRTWRFGLRSAIQKYCLESGAGKNLEDFQEGFINYWHKHLNDEEFVSFFIAPNLTWRQAYENMIEKEKLAKDKSAHDLMYEIEQRLKYEIMLEYGLGGRIGRTLEKSGCSVLAFMPEDITAIAKAVEERSVNELGVLQDETLEDYEHMVIGYLQQMRMHGAFADPVFDAYTSNDGKGYMLSNDYNRWLPGRQSGRNTPRFIAEKLGTGRKSFEFDSPSEKKYVDWISDCCKTLLVNDTVLNSLCHIILEEAEKKKVVVPVPSSPEYKIYGLSKKHVFISSHVLQARCIKCGTCYAIAEENGRFWDDVLCPRVHCDGRLEWNKDFTVDYYGKLFQSGDIERIKAREHTGLLERPDREKLEHDFKRSIDAKPWDPNVLSCTPTLEMGIDIGDLSSVVLCSMPPSQSQFLQRAGRAGRKDGNALTLAVANTRPHDLYFYSEPYDMISGDVVPPKVFLKASAVLERQFIAYCMDNWVKQGITEKDIPKKIGVVLRKLDDHPENLFPFNFINFVQRKLSTLLNSFIQMFSKYLDTNPQEELEQFARGTDTSAEHMQTKIVDAFTDLKKQQDALKKSVSDLRTMIKELEDKPEDSSFTEEIKKLKEERKALLRVLQEISDKDIFQFMCDEGLLPNYTFPEEGIILRAVLTRKEDNPADEPAPAVKQTAEKMKYEYNRSASSAISEFAPCNTFYAAGRKLTIDQVDLVTAQVDRWRLCPSCSHAQLEETGKNVASCPNCGSPSWADAGQVRNMLKVKMVYSNSDYRKSLIADDSDDRTNRFYCKQLLVDVDENHDIECAYSMNNEDFPFGYEFVRKATLREINFGESDTVGEKLYVSGVEEVRKGFRICKYCGKIQADPKKPNHSFTCKARNNPALAQAGAYEECLFLYREFTTEALRLLIPATNMDSTHVKMESFVAAFMLGMKEYFGNVDHLRVTVSEVPVAEADYRKQYLVVYDSVPGGTGYLKQLMQQPEALTTVFEKALHVMENCSCKDDPQKDGCYHCLFAYRQSRQIGNISRATAIRMLKSIISGKGNIERISRIHDIPVNPLFDSELEQRFMEAVRMKIGAANVKDTIRNGKHSYYLKIDETTWEVEPQVLLEAKDGVAVTCKPDFVFWPVSAPGHLPVAVFTDGFLYHKDIAADDTKKREAIRRSGKFRVWSLSFKDVQSVFAPQEVYATTTLAFVKMPIGTRMYKETVKKYNAEAIEPEKLAAFDLFFKYLTLPDAEKVFRGQAHAYALSLLDPLLMNKQIAFNSWHEAIQRVVEQTRFSDTDFVCPGTAFGTWKPAQTNVHLTVYAGILAQKMRTDGAVSVCACLDDRKEPRTDNYEKEWNGFWHFNNLMQFAREFIAVTVTGLEEMAYTELPVVMEEVVIPAETIPVSEENGWDMIKELLFSEEAKAFADMAKEKDLPVPEEDDIGFEVEGQDGEVIATIEIAWPNRKIGFMTEEQLPDKEKLEALGWRLLDLFSVADAKSLFGGEE